MQNLQEYRELMTEVEHPETDDHDADCALGEANALAWETFGDSTVPVSERLQIADLYIANVDIDAARRVIKEIARTA